MQTISHFLKPIGGAQAQPLRPDAALFALPEAVPIGLAGNLVVHVRPNGTADADPADLAGLEISTWRFVMAADWDPTTPPAFLCTDISHAAGSGIWTIQLAGSRTREMLLAIGRLGVATMGFELAGIAAGDTWASPSYLLQWKGPVVSRRDSGSTPWPAPDDPDTGGVPVHKSNHATGGSDSLAPSDIGAAAAQHSHAQADVTGLADALAGKAAAQHTHAQADVTGLADALDGKASTADATLTAVFSSWTCVPATYQGYTITVFDYVESNSWDLKAGNATIGSVNKSGDEDTRIVFRAGADWYGDVDLIATRIKSYQLGSQSDKPLAPAGYYAAASHTHTTSEITDFPTIPTNVSAFANDAGYLTEHQDISGKLDANKRNLLDYTIGTTLALGTAVYRSSLASAGTFPTVDATAIPTAAAYYCFELELSVPSTVPSTITGPSGWTWIDGHGLPDPADLSGGETICISVRLDCTARTFLASVWRVA